jgi:hypothetical protein
MRRRSDADVGGHPAQPPTHDAAAAARAELDRRAREQRERRSRAVAAAAAVGGMASLTLVLLGSPAAPTGRPPSARPGNSEVALTAMPDPAARARAALRPGHTELGATPR